MKKILVNGDIVDSTTVNFILTDKDSNECSEEWYKTFFKLFSSDDLKEILKTQVSHENFESAKIINNILNERLTKNNQ